MKKVFLLAVLLLIVTGCVTSTLCEGVVEYKDETSVLFAHEQGHDKNFWIESTLDIAPLPSFEELVSAEHLSLVEFTVLSSTRVDEGTQGYGGFGAHRYLLVLQIDDVILDSTTLWRWSGYRYYPIFGMDDVAMDDAALWRTPSKGDEVSIIAHFFTVLEEGQRYLTFFSPNGLIESFTAKINEDRSITATRSLGICLMEYNGYTVEQLREIANYILVYGYTPAWEMDEPSFVTDVFIRIPCGAWTFHDVDEASRAAIDIAAHLVPHNLQSDCNQAITRAEFSALAVSLYESLQGAIQGQGIFIDTYDEKVLKAAYIGIVSGVGENRFDPDGTLTREQAAVMLSRLSDVIGKPFPYPSQAHIFADSNDISPWAIESVARAYEAGIISGIGDNKFAPQQSLTREQGIITIMRMFNYVFGMDAIFFSPLNTN